MGLEVAVKTEISDLKQATSRLEALIREQGVTIAKILPLTYQLCDRPTPDEHLQLGRLKGAGC